MPADTLNSLEKCCVTVTMHNKEALCGLESSRKPLLQLCNKAALLQYAEQHRDKSLVSKPKVEKVKFQVSAS